MAVYKRGDTYWYEFWFEGERVRESAKTASRRTAETIEAKRRIELAEGAAGIKKKKPAPTFPTAVAEFLAWSKEHHAAHPNTHLRYQTSTKPLLRFFGNVKLDAITPENVEKYKTSRLKENKLRGGKLKKGEGQEKRRTGQKLKPATVNRELACLKIIFNHFIKQDVVMTNPVSRVKFPAENNEQMRVLSFRDQRAYLDAASQPLRDIASLMLETGMRPEEIYRLKKENVNLVEGWVFNPYGKTKAARRKVPLTSNAVELLRFRFEGAKGAYLFPHENDPDKPMLKANNAHYGALRRSGVKPFRLYDCRHTFASRAAMSGVDLVTLAALLGHSRIQMVMRYAHPTQEHQINAIKKLEEFNTMQMMETYAVGNPEVLQ